MTNTELQKHLDRMREDQLTFHAQRAAQMQNERDHPYRYAFRLVGMPMIAGAVSTLGTMLLVSWLT